MDFPAAAGHSDDATALIHQISRGIPRAINNLAIQALIAAYADNKGFVEESAARAAITESTAIGPTHPQAPRHGAGRPLLGPDRVLTARVATILTDVAPGSSHRPRLSNSGPELTSEGGRVIRELHENETALAHKAMSEPRTHLAGDQGAFLAQVNEVQRPQGFRVFGLFEARDRYAVAVVGFRRLASLAWCNVLYIDDLSTRPKYRRRGYGRLLLEAVAGEALALGCVAVHLDSGHHRYDAHRLYLEVGYEIRAHHFVRPVQEV